MDLIPDLTRIRGVRGFEDCPQAISHGRGAVAAVGGRSCAAAQTAAVALGGRPGHGGHGGCGNVPRITGATGGGGIQSKWALF